MHQIVPTSNQYPEDVWDAVRFMLAIEASDPHEAIHAAEPHIWTYVFPFWTMDGSSHKFELVPFALTPASRHAQTTEAWMTAVGIDDMLRFENMQYGLPGVDEEEVKLEETESEESGPEAETFEMLKRARNI